LSAGPYAGSTGYFVNTLGNTSLGWEKTHSTDLAVDLAFFKNRLQFTFDWYTKTTKDLLYQIPSLGASGFTSIWGNLGEIENRGFDVEFTSANIVKPNFNWSTSFNVSYNKNRVVSLGVDD